MPAPTPADCLEAMLRIIHDAPDTEELDPETQRKLERIVEASRDPQKMAALLGREEESQVFSDWTPETEADADLAEGPQSKPNAALIYAKEAAEDVGRKVVGEVREMLAGWKQPDPSSLALADAAKELATAAKAMKETRQQVGTYRKVIKTPEDGIQGVLETPVFEGDPPPI